MGNEGGPGVVLAALAIIVALVALGGIYLIIGSGGAATTTSTTTTTINISTNTTGTRTYGPSAEISEVALVYPNATLDSFSCIASDDCVVVRTQHCFNNLASQQACIDKEASGLYESYYESFQSNASMMACPQYLVLADASCGCVNRGCSLVYSPG